MQLVIWIHFSLFVLATNGWSIPRRQHRLYDSNSILASGGDDDSNLEALPSSSFQYTSEVVGAFGRMGSFFLCHQEPENEVSGAVAVPRGLAPGCLTKSGCPIFVATPSTAWPQIWKQTPEDRREDLVFVGNGIPPTECRDVGATFVVPHYSILQICTRNDTDNPIGTNDLSPKTFLYGKHSEYTATTLNRYGVATEIVKSFAEIKIKAAMKLVWASCMWLICHSATDDDDNAINFETVHKSHQEILDQLVEEIIPALERFVGQSVDRQEVHDYIKSYSLSIPNAIPSKDLALLELEDRNGLWLSLRTDKLPQVLHQRLIQEVAGSAFLEDALRLESDQEQSAVTITKDSDARNTLKLTEVELVVSGVISTTSHQRSLKRVVIVGSGILGSSVAFFLAKRLPDSDIRVLDLLSQEDLGRTTPASWAWLNANGKEPKPYQLLNQLGLHAWKKCALISELPSWMGSVVRFQSPPKFVSDGGYPSEGPLSLARITELEPFASWRLSKEDECDNEGSTYFFPNEGCVDPVEAVKAFRNASEKLGVKFIPNQNVTNILRDAETDSICGVESFTTSSSDGAMGGETSTVSPADLVIVAAGVGASAKCLGGLPLLHKPGQISYAKPSSDTPSTKRLSRILVDPLRSSHVLQRSDGYIVAGGGALEVGGSSGTVIVSPDNPDKGSSLLETAKELSPNILNQAEFSHTCKAIRPMPKDGLPAVGYLQQGLYTIVTHSGMTLGPLLSAIAAGEIAENMSCDLLSPFRPSRFSQQEET